MIIPEESKRFSQWQALLKKGNTTTLISLLQEAPIVDVAEFLQKQDLSTCVKLIDFFDKQTQASLFGHFTEAYQLDLYHALPRRTLATIFSHMSSDVRVDFYQKLDDKQQAQLLPYLPKKVKQDVITLSAYPPETAGGIMSTDFATVHHEMSVQKALDKVREDAPSKKMMYYLYVVNTDMRMIGFVSLKDMIMSNPQALIKEILKDTFVFAKVREDRESVAQKIEKYSLAALPVLNDDKQLVGIVSHDDALDVIRAEHTEDMERFMGITSDGQDYSKTPSREHFKKRIGWVGGLFIVSFLSGYIMHQYEDLLTFLPILPFYMTTINDAGGNTGSQAATMIIRALALRQISLKNWMAILFKELKVALMFMVTLALLTFIKVMVLSSPSATEPALYKIAFVISLSVSLQVLTATLIGATLPLFIHWLGKDPALAASPAITTIVDITGILIYFTTAVLFLS